MNHFPQAFKSFLDDVNIDDVETFHQLEMIFGNWAGRHYTGSSTQTEALRRESEKQGISAKRRFSAKYESYSFWTARGHTSNYQRRIASYMSSHPYASLKEARGHSRR